MTAKCHPVMRSLRQCAAFFFYCNLTFSISELNVENKAFEVWSGTTVYEDLTKPTVRQELGNTDSSLQLFEPAIDGFVACSREGVVREEGDFTRCLCAATSLLSSSQRAHSHFFNVCRLPGVSGTPGEGFSFNYSLPLKMPRLFIMIILTWYV